MLAARAKPGQSRLGRSLRGKLVVFFLVLDLTTLGVMTLGVAYNATDTVAAQVRKGLVDNVQFDARVIAEDLHTKWEQLRDISLNTLVVNGVIDSLGREAYLRPFVNKLRLAGRGGANPYLALLDYKGRLITANRPGHAPFSDAPWLAAVLDGGVHSAATQVPGKASGIRMAFPIFYQRQVEGILVSEFDFDFVRELAPDAEMPVSAIVDAAGQVLYGNAPEAVVQAVRLAGQSAQPTFVDQGDRLHAILRLPLPEGQPPLSWYVVLSVTTEQVEQPVAQLLWHIIVIGLLSALAVTALVFWRARRFVEPLVELQSTMHAIVDRGDLSQRVPAGTADEVGQLGQTFNRMIGKLQAQDDALLAEVAERRRAEDELRAANASLRQTLEALQTTQAQLVQSEKMASLGQLAAGVAHEINNPVGFVKSNIGTLRTYSQNLLSLLDRYEATIGSAEVEAARQALAAFRQQIDMEFVRGDLLALLDESEEGLVRIAKIVADLKDFSHVDRHEIESIDFNAMLDKVINVAWNELKYKADVIKDYGALPPLSCFPGRLGQVFLNLLVNAAQAMTDKGEIRIRTAVDGGDLVAEVSDTGCGIAPEILGKIFDPFFTTKPVGRGTGLGLHIAYTIVETHQGHLGVTSVVGRGTTFTVRLPLAGPGQSVPAALIDEPA